MPLQVSKKSLTQKPFQGLPSQKPSSAPAFPEIVSVTPNPQAPSVSIIPPYSVLINTNKVKEELFEPSVFLNSGLKSAAFGVGTTSTSHWTLSIDQDYYAQFLTIYGAVYAGTITRAYVSLRIQEPGGGQIYADFIQALVGTLQNGSLVIPLHGFLISQGQELELVTRVAATVGGNVECSAKITVRKKRLMT